MKLFLDIWHQGTWHPAASLESVGEPQSATAGKVHFEHTDAYVLNYLDQGGSRSISCRYPPNFELQTESGWPAFVFDLVPAGAARRSVLSRLSLADTPAVDWLLLGLAQFPPGNVRVSPADGPGVNDDSPPSTHRGFSRDEIIERGPDFVEYAFARGAPVAGSTGAQGDAPKFLLVQDHDGRWHAEGAIPDDDVASHWLVKFPRGRTQSDALILSTEAQYMELAQHFGLRANPGLVHQQGCLFVPRFERGPSSKLGLETVASLSGHKQFGQRQSLQTSAEAVARFVSEPGTELVEFLKRDIFNIAVGNTDNHVRNTSVIKYPDGRVQLSPVYDVAPMLIDRDGIPRACRWGDREEVGGDVGWQGVADDLEALGAARSLIDEAYERCAAQVAVMSERMTEMGIDATLVERLEGRQRQLARTLSAATRGTP